MNFKVNIEDVGNQLMFLSSIKKQIVTNINDEVEDLARLNNLHSLYFCYYDMDEHASVSYLRKDTNIDLEEFFIETSEVEIPLKDFIKKFNIHYLEMGEVDDYLSSINNIDLNIEKGRS